MAGIYIHIPFCKQACYYCDFHFSTSLSLQQEMTDALCHELLLQRGYLEGDRVNTIYLGGGTPSLLNAAQLGQILNTARRHADVAPDAEITLEANPDDLSTDKLAQLRDAGINRLSIGIQSFDNTVLQFLHRAHDSDAALRCVAQARAAGFDNISIDLIYAIPGQDDDAWLKNIRQALALDVPHISSYSLTVEEKTVFGRWASRGKLQPSEDEVAARQLEMLVAALQQAGYEQYEVSNFARPGWYSRHNSSYWRQEKYLGIGPSAHSYNGECRQYNISNNPLYLKALASDQIPCTVEPLRREDQVNDYLLTTLRTTWGADLAYLEQHWQYPIRTAQANYLDALVSNGLATLLDNRLTLTAKGKLLADKISSDLFLIAPEQVD